MSRRALAHVQTFLATETSSGAVLLAATIAALVWSNFPGSDAYESTWTHSLALGPAIMSLRHWINDVLMALFFLVVGLEIKKELVDGELSGIRKALLPVFAALGGMAAPALIFLAVNAGSDTVGGWGIPMATDIAFALGVLAFVGRGLPQSLRVFLLSLAIADDVGAIVVIAVFYAGAVHWAPLVAVALALAVPVSPYGELLQRLLHPWTSFVVVPLFALANAGVALSGDNLQAAFTSRLGLGIVAGLVAGKLLGVTAAIRLAGRAGIARPAEATKRQVIGVAALSGIGFTVSLFIADLAFEDPALGARAKVGILAGSLLAAAIGALILRRSNPRASEHSQS